MRRFFKSRQGPAFQPVSHTPVDITSPPQAMAAQMASADSRRFTQSQVNMARQSRYMPQPADFQSPIEKQRWTLLLALLTCGVMIFTVFFAYNSSLAVPISTKLIFDTPATSVLVLNIASQVTIFCLAELTICVFEAIRWALACSARGVQGYNFLALSRATNLMGVICLLVGGTTTKQSISGSHRLWGSQRVFFVILRSLLGVLLLSDISFKSTYPIVHSFPIDRAGLSPLNASLIDSKNFNVTATTEFWWYFPALLTDIKRVRGVAPLNCSGADNQCFSYFVPGSMADIDLDPSQPVLKASDYTKGTAYVQVDAPGYQLDFQRIDRLNDPFMTLHDCHLYGIDQVALQVCLKENGNDLLAAWNGCPPQVANQSSCLNTTDWRTIVPFNTKVSISQRRATTVFDRYNSSIIDIVDLSPPTPMNYTAAEFFTFYDQVFAVPFSEKNWNISVQYFFLLGVEQFLVNPTGTENGTGNNMQLSRLQDFLAAPVFLFNNVVYDAAGGPTPDMGKQALLAYTSYRLIIAPYTLYTFFVGSFFALAWCLIALACTMFVQTPNTSLFPELDIAAKIVTEEGHEPHPFAESRTLIDLLWPLSNAGTGTIRRALRGTQFFARFSEKEYEGTRRVVLTLQNNGLQLSKGTPVVMEKGSDVEEGDDKSTFEGEEGGFGGPGRTGTFETGPFTPGPFGAYRPEPYQADPMAEEFREGKRATPPLEMSSRYM